MLLAEGSDDRGDWRLVGRGADRCLLLVRRDGEGGSCDLTGPPRLEETSVTGIGSGPTAETLVAGLVPDGADQVVVDPSVGDTRAAVVHEGGALRWFVARLPGVTGVDQVVALADGQEVVEHEDPAAAPARGVRPPAERDRPTPRSVPPPPCAWPRPTTSAGSPSSGRGRRDSRSWSTGSTGSAGRRRSRRRGPVGQEPGGDYYVVDDETRTRTYRLTDETVFWGSIGLGAEPSTPRRVTLERWRDFLPTPVGGQTLWHVDVEDGVAVGIEEQYRP